MPQNTSSFIIIIIIIIIIREVVPQYVNSDM